MTDKVTAEEKFYSKEYSFSYSGLNKLLFSPRLWYKHYVLEEREEKTDLHLIEGKVIHALLLDGDNFSKNFIVSPIKLPSADTKGLLDRVFQYAKESELHDKELKEFGDKIIEILKDVDLHQSLKTDQQRIDKIVTDPNISYYEYLKTKEGKDIIDQETLDRCREDAELIRENKKVSRLLRIEEESSLKVIINNEYPVQKKLKGYPFGLKGIIDNVIIDHEEEIVYINDIKRTGKTLNDFEETVDYYNYWLQAAIYKELIGDMVPQGYTVKFTFIVIDKYQQVYPFEVSTVTMIKWSEKMKETLETAKFHYENRKFNLPIKFEKETVIL